MGNVGYTLLRKKLFIIKQYYRMMISKRFFFYERKVSVFYAVFLYMRQKGLQDAGLFV
jgi:hypothetical protein